MIADDSVCDSCVYHSMNLDPAMYEGKGIAGLPENGCSLDFVPGDRGCSEMRTNNCGARKTNPNIECLNPK